MRRRISNQSPPNHDDGWRALWAYTGDAAVGFGCSRKKRIISRLASGPLWFSVGPARTSAGPGVARPVKNPMLEHRVSAVIALDRAGIADPARSLSAADRRLEIRARLRLSNDLVTIDGIDGRVAIAMEHDGRHGLLGPATDEAPRPAAWQQTRRACHEQPRMPSPSGPQPPHRAQGKPSP